MSGLSHRPGYQQPDKPEARCLLREGEEERLAEDLLQVLDDPPMKAYANDDGVMVEVGYDYPKLAANLIERLREGR